MSITIHLESAHAAFDASADLGSPSRCGAVNFANVNAVAVLRIATGESEPWCSGSITRSQITTAIARIGAALAPTNTADLARSPALTPANDAPQHGGARVIIQPQTDERVRERLTVLLLLLSIALARGEGIAWS